MAIRLDLNAEEFQSDLLALERQDALAVLDTLDKIRKLEWNQLYADRGLKWELIGSGKRVTGPRLYSLRISRKARAVARRDGDWLRFVSLHSDHDSAYEK